MPNRSLLFVCAAFAAILGLGAAQSAAAAAAPRASWYHRLPSLVSDAVAQEVMKFEEVSPESAAAIEKQRATSRTRVGAAPPVPPAPEAPEVPAIPPVSRAGDVVRIGSDIHIEENQVVDGDVFALQGDIQVDGRVKGNVATTGGNVHLGSTARVDGDVMCIGGALTEDPGAVVGGQRVTALRGPANDRRISRKIRERLHERLDEETSRGSGVGFSISWLLSTLLVGWLFARFAPGRTGVALGMLRNEPGGSLMVGFVIVLLLIPSVVALALAVAVLCITIIGIPLALLLLPAYALALALLFLWGFTLGATVIGDRFASALGGPRSLVRSTVLGVLLVSGLLVASSILHFLPFFGWLGALLWVLGFVTFGLATMTGAGALVRSKFGQGPGGRWWPPFSRPGSPGPAAPVVPGATPGAAAPSAPVVAAAPVAGAPAPESYMPRETPGAPEPGSPAL